MIRIDYSHKGQTYTLWNAGRVVTITRNEAPLADGRWDGEDIVIEPYVQIVPDTDESEAIYGELTRLLRAALLPS